MTDFFVIALETRHLRSRGPTVELPAEAPGEGPPRLFQLLGAPGVRPWPGGRLPPISTWLLLCVRVSPLHCLVRTLSLGLGPPPSRRTSPQTLHSITSAKKEVKVLVASVVSNSANPWTVGSSVGFSRQEYWSGLPLPFSRGSSQPRDRT